MFCKIYFLSHSSEMNFTKFTFIFWHRKSLGAAHNRSELQNDTHCAIFHSMIELLTYNVITIIKNVLDVEDNVLLFSIRERCLSSQNDSKII